MLEKLKDRRLSRMIMPYLRAVLMEDCAFGELHEDARGRIKALHDRLDAKYANFKAPGVEPFEREKAYFTDLLEGLETEVEKGVYGVVVARWVQILMHACNPDDATGSGQEFNAFNANLIRIGLAKMEERDARGHLTPVD